jgi:hypothetical protein
MTSPLLLIASLITTRATNHPAPESVARSSVGRRARKTAGLARADTNGTRSTPEAYAALASTSGLQPSAPSVAGGRHIQIGMRNEVCQTIHRAQA